MEFGDDLVGGRKAKPRALPDGFGSEEGVEDFGLNLCGNAAAIIGDFDGNSGFVRLRSQFRRQGDFWRFDLLGDRKSVV